MTPRTEAKPKWMLYVVDEDGKEGEVGRFQTDAMALQFIDNYRITEWRLKGPDRVVLRSA